MSLSLHFSHLEHVVGCPAVLLAQGITRRVREVEGLATETPGRHDAPALEEIVRHVRRVALVARH